MVLPNSLRTPPPGASPPPGMTRPGRLRRLLVSGWGTGAPAAGTSASPNALEGSWGPAAVALLQPSARELSPIPHTKRAKENRAEVKSGLALSSLLHVPSGVTTADHVLGPARTSSRQAESQVPWALSPTTTHPTMPGDLGVKRWKEVKSTSESWNCRWMRKIRGRKCEWLCARHRCRC